MDVVAYFLSPNLGNFKEKVIITVMADRIAANMKVALREAA